jgi:RNA-directed DNA polymerase
MSGNSLVNAGGESYCGIVPTKQPNKSDESPAEAVEERPQTKENTRQPNLGRTPSRESRPTGLERVRETAKKDGKLKFTALLHHVSIDLLRKSYYSLKKQAAPGVDGMTWEEYGQDLEERLADLHGRIHRGAYRAQPSRRVWIPKADGRQRPLGIAALEDKIVQWAVGTVLNQIWEEDFLGFSYGFRPGRSQQDALDALWMGIVCKKVNWILDLDIRSFFDKLQHSWLVQFVEHRIGDRRVVRLIQKWLKAGVLEQGQWSETKEGSPQGAVISPVLANLYLHYVLDLWVEAWRKKQAHGDVIIVRYADDAVLGFEHREDAEHFLEQLRERLAKFGLELHPEKTRLIEFGRFAAERRKKRGARKPETFNFLGFTHILWDQPPDGQIHDPPEDDRQANGSQAQRNSSATAQAHARARPGNREVAAAGGDGVFPISRYSRQLGAAASVSQRRALELAPGASASQPTSSHELGTF